jgi:hypothetical protein
MPKKAKTAAKLKLPKEVAGVKIPKGLRKQAKKIVELIDSPAGRELAVAGLSLAASSLVAKTGNEQAKGAVKALTKAARKSAASDAANEAADLGAILRAAAAEGARRFLAGFEEAQSVKTQAPAARKRTARPGSSRKKAGSSG